MTKTVIFFAYLGIAISLLGAVIPKPAPVVAATTTSIPANASFPPGTHVNFNVNFSQNTSTSNVTKSNASAQTEALCNAQQEMPLLTGLNDLWSQLPNAKKLSQDFQTQAQNFLSMYKWRLIAISIASSYLFLCCYLYMGNLHLSNAQLWSSWHQEMPLDQLLAIPQQQYAHELIQEIRRRYTTVDNLTNLIQPLALFMNAIIQEEEQLLWYQKIFGWIAYTRLTKIIPISTKQFEKIPERLARIAYYKNLFQTWASNYQMEQSVKH